MLSFGEALEQVLALHHLLLGLLVEDGVIELRLLHELLIEELVFADLRLVGWFNLEGEQGLDVDAFEEGVLKDFRNSALGAEPLLAVLDQQPGDEVLCLW